MTSTITNADPLVRPNARPMARHSIAIFLAGVVATATVAFGIELATGDPSTAVAKPTTSVESPVVPTAEQGCPLRGRC